VDERDHTIRTALRFQPDAFRLLPEHPSSSMAASRGRRTQGGG
jgi:hypothetical protein